MSVAASNRDLTAVRNLLDAGRPLIYLQTPEEERAVRLLQAAAPETPLLTWSVTEGLLDGKRTLASQADGPRGILDFVIAHTKPAIFLLKDFHEFLASSAEVRRRLRDLYHACVRKGKFAVICSPIKVIPPELEREIAFVKLPLPDLGELQTLLREEAESLRVAGAAELAEDLLYTLGTALQGLTFDEARYAIRYAHRHAGQLDASAVALLQEEKRLLVGKSGLMDYVPDTVHIEHVGGLDVLKKWLTQRRDLFFSSDSVSVEIVPKGILLMGISGCGKSLSARAVASVFGLPLYRVDMAQVFAMGTGHAERLFADACRTMEEIAPAVVWFDEIENAITRQHQDSSGVLDRIFGYFLTWMQEKPLGLFVAATANRIDLLPAEMIRKGRFDQVFFIDLPDYQERMEIFRIHLQRRQVVVQELTLELATVRTEGWTGAEIEQAVISALTAARLNGEPLTDKYLLPALNEIVPLSKTMQEQVKHIRAWASDRAVCASSKGPHRKSSKPQPPASGTP
ncbi:MAG: AAA family ATPase [Phycisphaerae bacterium]|nr:AAA family ATPase [Phycisphaerae bacterium]